MRETCCCTHHIFLVWSPNERVCHVLSGIRNISASMFHTLSTQNIAYVCIVELIFCLVVDASVQRVCVGSEDMDRCTAYAVTSSKSSEHIARPRWRSVVRRKTQWRKPGIYAGLSGGKREEYVQKFRTEDGAEPWEFMNDKHYIFTIWSSHLNSSAAYEVLLFIRCWLDKLVVNDCK